MEYGCAYKQENQSHNCMNHGGHGYDEVNNTLQVQRLMYEVENLKSGVMAEQRQQASMIDLERTKEKYKTIIRQKNQESFDLNSKLERKSKEVESKDEKLEWLQVQLKADS